LAERNRIFLVKR